MIVVFRGPVSRSERVALGVALLLATALLLPLWGSVSDTTYVWMQYARNLARGAGLVFNPGERVYACTNPLWVAVLGDAVGLGIDPLVFAKFVGVAATLVSVALFLQLMRRTVRVPSLRAIATVVFAGHAWVAAYAVSGLETVLAMALVLAGFVALTEGADWGDRPVRTGALWALAALTRPGAVLLIVLWGTALLADAQNRPGLRRLLFGITPAVAIYGAWLLFARVYFGSFWPRVLTLEAGAPGDAMHWAHRLASAVEPLVATDGVLLGAGLVALATAPWPKIGRDRGALRLLPIVWVVALPALFAARGIQAGPRQLLMVTPIAQALAWQAIDRWWTTRRRSLGGARIAAVGLALGAVVVAQNLIAYRTRVEPFVRSRTIEVREALLPWGRWLRTHAPASTRVASPLPGALAYTSGLTVLDLTGLLTPGAAAALRDAHDDRAVAAALATPPLARPDYLVEIAAPDSAPRASRSGRAFEILATRAGLTFARVHWDRMDLPRHP